MPLYIRDDDVAQLARHLQAESGHRTVTEAVRSALQHELDRLREGLPLRLRLDKALTIADAVGTCDADR